MTLPNPHSQAGLHARPQASTSQSPHALTTSPPCIPLSWPAAPGLSAWRQRGKGGVAVPCSPQPPGGGRPSCGMGRHTQSWVASRQLPATFPTPAPAAQQQQDGGIAVHLAAAPVRLRGSWQDGGTPNGRRMPNPRPNWPARRQNMPSPAMLAPQATNGVLPSPYFAPSHSTSSPTPGHTFLYLRYR